MLDGFDNNGLPESFDVEQVVFHELKHCEICEQVWGMTIRRHHCRKCGKSVCSKCSAQLKPLSKADVASKTAYRVCDGCDTELENFKLKQNHDEIIKAQAE
jgi:hypothetical protein